MEVILMSPTQVKLTEIAMSEKSNQDLMMLYTAQVLSRSPQAAVVRAVTNLMKKRNIVPKEIVVGFKFTVEGEDVTIQGVSLKEGIDE
jgi:RNase H-fold protein (predicted Holliday junction resolvase)